MVIMQGIRGIAKMNFGLLDCIYSAIVWIILVSINSAEGTINAPWIQSTFTIIESLLAFVVYGIIVTYTIKNNRRLSIKD